MASILLLPEFPQGSAHIGGLQLVMTMVSMFTDMAGNIPFLRWLTGGAEHSAQHGKGALLMVLIITGEDN